MKPDALTLVILIFCLACLLTWGAIWMNRRSLSRWIVRRMMVRKQIEDAEAFLREARTERWLTYAGEYALRVEVGLSTEGMSPEGEAPTLKQHLDRLFKFYFPKKG